MIRNEMNLISLYIFTFGFINCCYCCCCGHVSHSGCVPEHIQTTSPNPTWYPVIKIVKLYSSTGRKHIACTKFIYQIRSRKILAILDYAIHKITDKIVYYRIDVLMLNISREPPNRIDTENKKRPTQKKPAEKTK